MNCHDAQSQAGDFALGLLSDDEHSAVQRHLDSGCESCLRALAETNRALMALVDETPPVAPPARVKQELFDRIDSAQVSPRESSPASLEPALNRRRRWSVSAVAVAAATVILGTCRFAGVFDPPSNATAVRVWQQQIAGADRVFGLDGTSLVSLELQAVSRLLLSHALSDQASGQLHIWTRPLEADEGVIPNRVWMLNPEGDVVGHSPLKARGSRLGAVLSPGKLKRATSYWLLLTHETNPLSNSPGPTRLDTATIVIK